MKNLCLFILLFTFLLFQSAYAQDCKTDEFTGDTKCQSKFIKLEPLEAQTNVAGIVVSAIPKDDIYGVLFLSSSDKWEWLEDDKAYLIYDEKRKQFPIENAGNHVGDDGDVVEQKLIFLTPNEIRKYFIQPNNLKIRIGRNNSYIIPKEFSKKASELLKQLN